MWDVGVPCHRVAGCVCGQNGGIDDRCFGLLCGVKREGFVQSLEGCVVGADCVSCSAPIVFPA